jgi:tetratricopeptide (TPR) repeat protein
MLAGDIARDLGHADVALASFERAVALAGDDRERCAAYVGVASAHRLTTSIERGFAALDAATPLAQSCGLVGERARIAYLRGSLEFVSGALGRCAASHEEALVHARSAGDERCEAYALSGLADVAYANGRLRSAQQAFERCVALAEGAGDLRFTLMNRNMAGLIRFYLGRLPDALDLLQRTLALSREIGHRVAEVMADECVGLVLVGAGRDAEAVEPLERSLALGREIGSRRFAAIDLAMLGIVARRAGDVVAARERLDESWSMLVDIGPRFAGPLVLAAQARVAASRAKRRELLHQGEAMLADGSLSHNHLWYRDGAIDCALEAGELDEALRHAGELERFAAAEPTPWSDLVVARARALVEAARGRPDAKALQALVRRANALHLDAARPALETALAAASR